MTCQRPNLRAETSTKISMNALNPNYNTTRPNSGLNWCNELSHLHRPTHNGMRVSIMPLKTVIAHTGWVAVLVWMSFALKPIDVCFHIFAQRSPCQQYQDSVAGPDEGRWAAGIEFLVYHSNFVVHHFELKARENCRNRLVRLFQLATKDSHYFCTAQVPHRWLCTFSQGPKLVSNLHDETHMPLTFDNFIVR